MAFCNQCKCQDRPTSVTFAGATGCMDVMNGTFGLTYRPDGRPSPNCQSSYLLAYDPADGDCASPPSCFYHDTGRYRYYLYLILLQAAVSFNTSNTNCVARIQSSWKRWVDYYNPLPGDTGGCNLGDIGTTQVQGTAIFQRSACTTGTMVWDSGGLLDTGTSAFPDLGVHMGTVPTSCTIAF